MATLVVNEGRVFCNSQLKLQLGSGFQVPPRPADILSYSTLRNVSISHLFFISVYEFHTFFGHI
jgi:hypothetical protein